MIELPISGNCLPFTVRKMQRPVDEISISPLYRADIKDIYTRHGKDLAQIPDGIDAVCKRREFDIVIRESCIVIFLKSPRNGDVLVCVCQQPLTAVETPATYP